MLLCLIALIVFSILSVFSARHRELAKQAFSCVLTSLTFRPCEANAGDLLKVEIVRSLSKISKPAARLVNRNFFLFSWTFTVLTIASFALSLVSVYNFYFYGNCNGPGSLEACVLNDITGDYGRFKEPGELGQPLNLNGLTYGNPNSPNVIVEFGCFTCPYTKKAEPSVYKLLNRDDVYYIFKPFPLPNHENSFEAAKAVLCAAEQNREMELRKIIFDNQEVCGVGEPEDILFMFAEQSGLNMSEFKNCYYSKEIDLELNSFVEEGNKIGIYATPTFYINGKAYVGPSALEEWLNEN